jgi:hypothetical protein
MSEATLTRLEGEAKRRGIGSRGKDEHPSHRRLREILGMSEASAAEPDMLRKALWALMQQPDDAPSASPFPGLAPGERRAIPAPSSNDRTAEAIPSVETLTTVRRPAVPTPSQEQELEPSPPVVTYPLVLGSWLVISAEHARFGGEDGPIYNIRDLEREHGSRWWERRVDWWERRV